MLNFRTLPLMGSRLIEASAGTGKTYTIALLYVRLVLGHCGPTGFSSGLTPAEILVVTFTDAASQELRDRIRQRLSQAAAWFADPTQVDAADPLSQIIQDFLPQQHATCARRLQEAAEAMDQAAVSTIHGWCYRTLRQHAFDTRNPFQQELNADPSDLLLEITQDYWRQHFYPHADQLPLARAIQDCWSSPQNLLAELQPLLQRPHAQPVLDGRLLEPPQDLAACLQAAAQHLQRREDWDQHCQDLEQTARSQWLEDWHQIAGLLRPLPFNKNRYLRNISLDELLAELRRWVDGGPAPGTNGGKLRLFASGGFQLNRKHPHPTHPAFDRLAEYIQARDEAPGEPEVPLRCELLLHAADWVARQREQRLLERGQVGYDDMLLRLRDALRGSGGPRLAAAIRGKFPVAMIDEFQDTDPIQYEIFDRIYRVQDNDPATGLLLIGDPKQAIYAFRGADIYTYLQARQACRGRLESLGTNFRSTQGLVQAVNALFQQAETRPAGAFHFKQAQDNPVPYVAVEARGRTESLQIDGRPVIPMNLWYMPGANEHGVSGPAEYRQELAEATASEIVRWLQQAQQGRTGFQTADGLRPLQPRDIAILVRTGSEAATIRQSLRRRGVNSVYLSDRDSVFASREAPDVWRWLQAAAHPGDQRLLKIALTTASMSLPLPTLKQIFHDEDRWEETVEHFRDYQHRWQRQGVLPMLRRLLLDYQIPARLRMEPGGERKLTNLLHLAEWLQQTSRRVDGDLALIRQLGRQIEHPTEEEILRLESDDDLIKVVTIHKSKGLEYPLVLLPFVCIRRSVFRGRQPVIHFHPSASPDGQSTLWAELAGSSQLARESFQQADRERLSEDLRLLYVAMTRAQHGLWLGIAPLGDNLRARKNCLHESGIGTLLFGDKIESQEVEPRLADLVQQVPTATLTGLPKISQNRYQPPQPAALLPARTASTRIPDDWWIASYSALQIGAPDDSFDPAETAPLAVAQEEALQESPAELTIATGGAGKAVAESVVVANAEPPDIDPQGSSLATDADLHTFPRGPDPGTFLHALLEWSTTRGFPRVARDDQARRDYIAACCRRRGWESWIDVLDPWLKRLLTRPLPLDGQTQLVLADIPQPACRAELEFWCDSARVSVAHLDRLVRQGTLDQADRPAFAAQSLYGMLKGFIDLVAVHQGRYYVVDWKSNYLGPSQRDYDRTALRGAILEKRYDMQYALYLLALHRHLKQRLPDYSYQRDMGGAVYVFLRGIEHPETAGVHFDRPSQGWMEDMDALLADGSIREGVA